MKQFRKEDILLLKQILRIPYQTLLNEIRTKDLEEKKHLIEMMEFYKEIYYKTKNNLIKEIVNYLIEELEILNKKLDLKLR